MPLVVIQYKLWKISEGVVEKLAQKMPGIVASALSVDDDADAILGPKDIEVWVQRAGGSDVNTKDLEIIIWANSYPRRLANLDERRERIQKSVLHFLAENFPDDPHISGFVWVLLQPGSFGEL